MLNVSFLFLRFRSIKHFLKTCSPIATKDSCDIKHNIEMYFMKFIFVFTIKTLFSTISF
jgi:hypothetical protein